MLALVLPARQQPLRHDPPRPNHLPSLPLHKDRRALPHALKMVGTHPAVLVLHESARTTRHPAGILAAAAGAPGQAATDAADAGRAADGAAGARGGAARGAGRAAAGAEGAQARGRQGEEGAGGGEGGEGD